MLTESEISFVELNARKEIAGGNHDISFIFSTLLLCYDCAHSSSCFTTNFHAQIFNVDNYFHFGFYIYHTAVYILKLKKIKWDN